MGPTSKGRKGVDGNEGNGRMSERGEGQGKGEWKGRGRKERGTDLTDQCHTASYTPDLFFCNLQSYIRNIKMSEFGTQNKIHYGTKINTIRLLNEISTDIFFTLSSKNTVWHILFKQKMTLLSLRNLQKHNLYYAKYFPTKASKLQFCCCCRIVHN